MTNAYVVNIYIIILAICITEKYWKSKHLLMGSWFIMVQARMQPYEAFKKKKETI